MTALDTRTKLMDAAEHAVCANGADGFSYANLASQIGIRKASIHYHFPTKSDLLTAIMARYAETVLAALQNITDTHQTPDARLRAFIEIYRQALNKGQTLCLCVAYTVSQNGLSPDTRQEILKFRNAVQTWLKEACANSQYPAPAILAQVEGAQIAARIAQNTAAFDAATENLTAAHAS